MKLAAAVVVGLVGLASGQSASAAVLAATAVNASYSGFDITFTDNNGNGILDFGEESGFSSVRFNVGLPNEIVYTTVLGFPATMSTVAGVIPGGNTDPEPWENRGLWLFGPGQPDFGEAIATFWTYEITGLSEPSVVPLPGGLPLLLAGMGALWVLRRRQAA
jgi:opacity protein-like surface antigen